MCTCQQGTGSALYTIGHVNRPCCLRAFHPPGPAARPPGRPAARPAVGTMAHVHTDPPLPRTNTADVDRGCEHGRAWTVLSSRTLPPCSMLLNRASPISRKAHLRQSPSSGVASAHEMDTEDGI